MPFGGMLSLGLGAVTAGSSLAGLLGGTPASNVAMPPQYNFKHKREADNAAYSGIGDLGQYNVAGQYLPAYQQIMESSINNPYAAQYQQGANATGAAGFDAGQQQLSTGLGMLPDVNALLAMGFDPQNAYYARAAQRMQDQTRAGQSARGIATTPYGAGLENQAMSNFNLDWEYQALQRAMAGAQGAGNLYGAANSGINSGLGTMYAGAGTPYATFQGINANALQTLAGGGQFGQQAAAIPQQQVSDYLNYLGRSTAQQQANNQSAGLGLQQAGMDFNQSMALGQNAGNGLNMLAKGWQATNNPFAGLGQPQQSGYGFTMA